MRDRRSSTRADRRSLKGLGHGVGGFGLRVRLAAAGGMGHHAASVMGHAAGVCTIVVMVVVVVAVGLPAGNSSV